MLRAGQRFVLGGQPYRVQYINPGRAHCVSVAKRTVTVTDKKGRTRSFEATTSETLDISPDTNLEILRELDSNGSTR